MFEANGTDKILVENTEIIIEKHISPEDTEQKLPNHKIGTRKRIYSLSVTVSEDFLK